MEVYLDNGATTRPYPEVIKEMQRIMEEKYGNASSLHRFGSKAERIISSSRRTLAELFGSKDSEIIFTSGGTESNNLAIQGIARRYRRRGNHLITTALEHPSVLQSFQQLEEEGFEATYLLPDSTGAIDPQKIAEALTPHTVLVSIMHVNNEIGSIQPLARISSIIKKQNPGIFFHVDAVQSFGKFPLHPEELGIDALSISAHKFHGPKGIGALYLKEGVFLKPLFQGGGQEKGIRPGTENTPAVAGMALAARLCFDRQKDKIKQLRGFKEKLISSITAEHPQANLNGPQGEEGAPHILNISFPGLKGEVILHALEEHSIYVSTGSACHSGSQDPSHVLQAIGISDECLEGAVRISFSFLNTEKEIDYAAAKINSVISDLKKFQEARP
ncbi:MAG: cysteine desulfurase [Firmicutes bacterium]|nr:cysteine desulfurase [Bacillota bacterium]